MTTRKELAQKLAELPTFNLRFGSRVDIFNLPADDRDLIVRSLEELDDVAEKGQNLTAEFEKLRDKIRSVTLEREEFAAKYRALASEQAKLAEQRRIVAVEHAELDGRYRALTAKHAELNEKYRASANRHPDLEDKSRALVAERDGALDVLVRLVNGEEEAADLTGWLQTKYPDRAASIRRVPAKGGWRPIETAPKDNSQVNLIGRNSAGRWVVPVVSRRNMISADSGLDRWLEWEHPFPPTHWYPIPVPPPVPAVAGSDVATAAPASRSVDDQAWLHEDLQFLSKANKR